MKGGVLRFGTDDWFREKKHGRLQMRWEETRNTLDLEAAGSGHKQIGIGWGDIHPKKD